jgi:hypothetical protein
MWQGRWGDPFCIVDNHGWISYYGQCNYVELDQTD